MACHTCFVLLANGQRKIHNNFVDLLILSASYQHLLIPAVPPGEQAAVLSYLSAPVNTSYRLSLIRIWGIFMSLPRSLKWEM